MVDGFGCSFVVVNLGLWSFMSSDLSVLFDCLCMGVVWPVLFDCQCMGVVISK